MARKKEKLLLLLPGILLLLTGCSPKRSAAGSNSYNTDNVAKRLTVTSFDKGKDGVEAGITVMDPHSYDDTLSITKYVYDNSETLQGFYENGKITVEDALRKEVKTSVGDEHGYPIVDIGDNAFRSLKGKVTSVHLGKFVTSIGAYAFKDNASLSEINLDELTDLSYIGEGAFDNTPFYSSRIASKTGAVCFGHVLYAFNDDKAESYEVPNDITMIAPQAFKGKSNLRKLTFAENSSLREIGNNAFEGTSLSSVTLPLTVKKVGKEAFSSCSSLAEINLGKAQAEEGVLKDDTKIRKLTYSGNIEASELFEGGSYKAIPEITSVGLTGDEVISAAFKEVSEDGMNYAFNKVTSLSLKGAKVLRSGALSGLNNVQTITDDSSVIYLEDNSLKESPWFASRPEGIVKLGTAVLAIKGEAGDLKVPEGTTGVAQGAFEDMPSLTSLPSSLMYVGKEAFKNDTGLKEIDLPQSKEIGNEAFHSCTNLERISLADFTLLGDEAIASGMDFFDVSKAPLNAQGLVDTNDGSSSLTGVFAGDNNVTDLEIPWGFNLSRLFDSNPMFSTVSSLISNLKKAVIKEGPYLLTNNFLENAVNLEEIELPDTLGYIGLYALKGEEKLTEISLPSSVIEIRREGLADCPSLVNVNFEVKKKEGAEKLSFNGVETFGAFVFRNDTSLESSSINKGERKGGEAVKGVFKFPESLKYVSGGLFFNDHLLNSIDLRMPRYYYDGVVKKTDVKDDQEYIQFRSKDWNTDTTRGKDKYGGPFTLPYNLVFLDD